MARLLRRSLCSLLAMTVVAASTAFATSTLDVYFDHTYEYLFTRNDQPRDVSPILIVDQNGQSIKAAHGLRIIIPIDLYTLWDTSVASVTASGSGVITQKMNAALTPVYSDNLKEVFFPVRADFAQGEQVNIEGLKMKVYNRANDRRYIGLDLNGDRISDVVNFRSIQISSTETRTDIVAPYPPRTLTGSYNNARITVTWQDPPDYDLERLFLVRSLIRNGAQASSIVEFYPGDQRYIDEDVRAGESVTYALTARDNINASEPVSIVVSASQTAVGSSTSSGTTTVGTTTTGTTTTGTTTTSADTGSSTENLYSDIGGLAVQDQSTIQDMTNLMLEHTTYKMPLTNRFRPTRLVDGSFALSLILAVSGDGCGSETYNYRSCLREAREKGYISSYLSSRKKISRIEFYEMLFKAAGTELQNGSTSELLSECADTRNPTENIAKVYFTAKHIGIFESSTSNNRCRLNSKIGRLEAVRAAEGVRNYQE